MLIVVLFNMLILSCSPQRLPDSSPTATDTGDACCGGDNPIPPPPPGG